MSFAQIWSKNVQTTALKSRRGKMIPYPTTLPVADIQAIVDDIRAGTIVTDRAKFAKAVWELSGYALKETIGEATAPKSDSHTFFESSQPLSDLEVADYLETMIQPDNVKTGLPIPWLLILKWTLRALLTLL